MYLKEIKKNAHLEVEGGGGGVVEEKGEGGGVVEGGEGEGEDAGGDQARPHQQPLGGGEAKYQHLKKK